MQPEIQQVVLYQEWGSCDLHVPSAVSIAPIFAPRISAIRPVRRLRRR